MVDATAHAFTINAGLGYCSTCGQGMAANAASCPKCGAPNLRARRRVSEKNIVLALVLCFFLGPLGIHRFYVGKTGTGILMLVTLGGFGIWVLIDLIILLTGSFRDAYGLRLKW